MARLCPKEKSGSPRQHHGKNTAEESDILRLSATFSLGNLGSDLVFACELSMTPFLHLGNINNDT